MSASLSRAFSFALVLSVAALSAAPSFAATVGRGGTGGASSSGAAGGNRVPELVSGPQGNCNGAIACVRIPPKPIYKTYGNCSQNVIDDVYAGDRHACRRDLGL